MQHDQGSHFILARNKRRIGPFTYEQVKQMAAAGAIQPIDMLLQEGQVKWQAAREIKSLFPVHNADLAVKRPPERCYMNPLQPSHWYLAKNKQRLGPFTAEQLMQMAATGMIQPSDMVLEKGTQKWCPFSEAQVPAQANRKPRAFARLKLLSLSVSAAMLVLLFGLWATGLIGSKPSQPEPVQQAQAESKKDSSRNSQKDGPSQKGNPASIPHNPKTVAEKERPAASGQDKPADKNSENDGQDQKKTERPKQARAERLASIRENNKAKLRTIATEIAKLIEELARLDKLLTANSSRDLSPDERQRLRADLEKRRAEAKKRESPGQLPTMIVEEDVLGQKRHEWNKERTHVLQLLQIAEKKPIHVYQEERKLLVQSPEAGDPSFVEHDGLLYTKGELFHYLFAVPFRYGALSQVTGTVADVNGKSVEIRYSLLLFDRRPGRRLRPAEMEIRSYNQTLILSATTDVRIWSNGEAPGQKDKPPTKNENPPLGGKSVGFPTPGEIMAKQKQGLPLHPKDIFPGGDNPGGFPASQLEGAKPTVDNHGNPVFTEDMIKGYRQGAIKSLRRGQEVSAFFSNKDHAVVIVIMRSSGGRDGSAVDRKKDQAPQQEMQKLRTDMGGLPRSFGVPKGTRSSPVGGRR